MFPRKDDSFFQLSLTELAFVLIFLVLLLIGAKVVLVTSDSSRCQIELGACNEKAAACTKEKTECFEALAIWGENPEAVISELVRAPLLQRENDQLRAKNQQLEAEVTAMAEIKEKTPDPVRAKAAEEFLSAYEKGTKTSVAPKDAAKRGDEAARHARDLTDCRGQLTHCTRSTIARKTGYGLPPCWTDEAGKVQYLMRVEIRSDGLAAKRTQLPPERETEAEQLPGFKSTLDAGVQSLDQFKANTLPIFDASEKANPKCRHYVVIQRDRGLRDIDLFNRLRLGIEDHFYKRDDTAAAQR